MADGWGGVGGHEPFPPLSIGSALGSPEALFIPTTSLGESLPPALVSAHLDNDPPEVSAGKPVSFELLLASTLDPTEHPRGLGMMTLPRRTQVRPFESPMHRDAPPICKSKSNNTNA